MSLRDRLRPAVPAPPPEEQERAAAAALAARRGRAPIQPAPRAGKAAAAILRPLRKGGAMGFGELSRRWAEIAGEPFAGKTAPEKLAAGVLTIRAPGPLAPFLQLQIPLLIERLTLAGAKVSSVRIEQRALPRPKPGNLRPVKRALTAEEEAALARGVEGVADPGLRSALLRLGRAVRQG